MAFAVQVRMLREQLAQQGGTRSGKAGNADKLRMHKVVVECPAGGGLGPLQILRYPGAGKIYLFRAMVGACRINLT